MRAFCGYMGAGSISFDLINMEQRPDDTYRMLFNDSSLSFRFQLFYKGHFVRRCSWAAGIQQVPQ